MKLTPAQRARLAEIVTWRPTGTRPLHPIYAGDAIDDALIAAKLITIDPIRIKLASDRTITDKHWCIATAEGEAEVTKARPRRPGAR